MREHEFYAIKVIDLKKFKGSNIKMAENELKISQSICHPNIVRCYDVYKTEKFYYIVSEYCPHGDLLQFIKKKGTISEG